MKRRQRAPHTGAESTLIHPRALAALGVDAERGRPVTVTGVTGVAEGPPSPWEAWR